jgi:predicted phage terminase large subunit-like protein
MTSHDARLMRADFNAFIQQCFQQINPGTEFQPNWHLELLAAKLDAVRRGLIRRLIINVPPRHLKSLTASIALPAWWLGHAPSAQILCVSYAQGLADKLATQCRSVMLSPWYQQLFATRLSPSQQAREEFVTTAEGYRLATSVGGVLTGRGGDVIIIDDPLKPSEALSDTQRAAVNAWYDHTLSSRLNDKQRGAIILVMQRLHEDDLVAHVLRQEPWEVVCFAAIAQEREQHVIETAFGRYTHTREIDEALHAARESRQTLDVLRAKLGDYHFAAQYQQAPTGLDAGMIKRAWFKHYREPERPAHFDQIVQSWDTANKASELSDYSVCTTWGVKAGDIYLLHVLRERLNYPELKTTVLEQQRAWAAAVVLIEDRASGTQLIQELHHARCHAVQGVAPESDKQMRLYAQSGTIKSFVYLPTEAPWLEDYLHELTNFPNAKHDDQADSTSQALAWIKQACAEPAMITFVREELMRRKHQR